MKLIIKIVFLLCLIYVSTSKDIHIFLQKYLSSCNQKYCNVSTPCRPINRSSKMFSTDIYFHPGVKLEAPIYIQIAAYKKFRTQYRQHMLKLKDELCVQLSLKNHPIYQLVENAGFPLSVAAGGGNLLDPCPLKGHRYVPQEITQPDVHIFPLIPVGEWFIEFLLTKNVNKSEENIISLSMYFEVKPTGAKEF